MEDEADHSEAVANFTAITGSSDHVALHYLESCNYDVERAVDFFFSHPPDTAHHASGDDMQEGAPTHPAFHDVGDDDLPMGPQGAEDAPIDLAGEDEEFQRALAASMGGGGAGGESWKETCTSPKTIHH